MNKIIVLGLLFFCIAQLSSQILPNPTEIKFEDGYFTLKNNTKIGFQSIGELSAHELIFQLKKSTGFHFIKTSKKIKKGILFTTKGATVSLGEEGYLLEISPKQIVIRANNEKGMFYAVQSLLQLFPVEVYSETVRTNIKWTVACQKIKDKPKYEVRSFMLDSGRQYQTPEFIKRYLDYMAILKMNVFHWHLTEGQGWRIEIKKYPLLTSIGSNVAEGKQQQGYYTQEDIKDIVAYASKKQITVIPEIDVPGHSEAALTAYPEYTCFGKAPESVMAFSSHLFCGGNESTYAFLQDILDEVCELFPGQYIHLGGDEAPKKDWDKCPVCQEKIKKEGLKDSHELQLYFSSRLANYLKTKNKKVIFWGDVVYHDGVELPDNVIVHWWNSRRHKDLALRNAINRGHQVIAGTNNYSYLNFPLTPWSKYKQNRTFDLETMYTQNPSDLENPNDLVLGMSTSLWTDWYVQEHMIDRRVFPRIFAIAEQMWSTADRKPFEEFYTDVKSKYRMLEVLGIDYGPAMQEEITPDFSWD